MACSGKTCALNGAFCPAMLWRRQAEIRTQLVPHRFAKPWLSKLPHVYCLVLVLLLGEISSSFSLCCKTQRAARTALSNPRPEAEPD